MTRAANLCIRVSHSDPLVMAGLVSLIGQEPGFEVQTGQGLKVGMVNVIVADYAFALSLLTSASASNASSGSRAPRIIVVTRRVREGEVMHAIGSGAHGYLLQDASPAELMDAIRHVARGGVLYLCRRTMTLFGRTALCEGFTAREEEVLRFLVKGDCNKGIARKLDISANTVKAHVSRICEKLHVSSRAQVAVKVTQRGLVRV